MNEVIRCINCQEWVGEQIKVDTKTKGTFWYWYCGNCGESWAVEKFNSK